MTAPGPFGYGAFRLLWSASLVGNIALWMQNVGAASSMAALTPSTMMVALVQTATSLPIFLFGLLGGVLADRVDRRRWLMLTQAWMLAVSATLYALTTAGGMTPTLLLTLTFALGAGNALNSAAWLTTVSEAVPNEVLPSAVAMNSAAYNLARVVGPAAGGLVIAAWGTGPVFLLNTLCFAAVILLLTRWRPVRQPSTLPLESLLASIRGSMRYIRHAATVRITLLRLTTLMSAGSAIWALLPLFARDQLGLGALGYGLMLGALGAGAVAAALLLPRLRQHFPVNTLIGSASLLYAAVIAAIAFVSTAPLAWTLLLFGGAAWIAALSNFTAVIQTSVPGWVRARVGAVYILSAHGAMALGSIAWGAVASATGLREALLLSALATALSVALTHRRALGLGDQAAHTPASRPALPPASIPGTGEGPVVIEIHYRIDPAQRTDFLHAAGVLGTIRRRNGADQWNLYRATDDDGHYVERFAASSWLDHLRQHERASNADHEVEMRVQAFHQDETPPPVRHYVAETSPPPE